MMVAGLSIGCILAYIAVGGFVWESMPTRWDDPDSNGTCLPVRGFLSTFWPCAFAGYVVYRIAMIGPRTIGARRTKLARAQVVRS